MEHAGRSNYWTSLIHGMKYTKFEAVLEGQFRSLEAIIEDEVRPRDAAHLLSRISDEARPSTADTLKRKGGGSFGIRNYLVRLQQIGVP